MNCCFLNFCNFETRVIGTVRMNVLWLENLRIKKTTVGFVYLEFYNEGKTGNSLLVLV